MRLRVLFAACGVGALMWAAIIGLVVLMFRLVS